jgi:hypothetical protein
MPSVFQSQFIIAYPVSSCSGSSKSGSGGCSSGSSSSKIKQSFYRPIWFQDVEAPRLLDIRHMKVVGLSTHTPAAFTPQEIFLLEASVYPRAIVQPGQLC